MSGWAGSEHGGRRACSSAATGGYSWWSACGPGRTPDSTTVPGRIRPATPRGPIARPVTESLLHHYGMLSVRACPRVQVHTPNAEAVVGGLMRDHLMPLAAVAATLAASSAVGLSPSTAAASTWRSEARLATAASTGARAAFAVSGGRAGGAAAIPARPLLLITGDQVWTGSIGGKVRVTG